MSASQSPLAKTSPDASGLHHFHADDAFCPLCEQSIPDDRADEIRERIAQRERQQDAAIRARVKTEFAREKAEAVEAAKEAERKTAEDAAAKKIATAEATHKDAIAEMKAAADAERSAKETAVAASADLKKRLDDAARDKEAALVEAKKRAAAREGDIRKEVQADATKAFQDRIAAADTAKAEADAKAAAAATRLEALEKKHEEDVAARVKETRDAMEQAKTDAVNAEKSKAFDEKLKLSGKIEDLQRALDKKTAEELGEGAEIDLFEALKGEFGNDRIERINKGQPGADIRHVVIHNGKECGSILYDSKDHKAWRNDFVTKLSSDKLAAKAEHAILSTRVFPAGARQLDARNGVVIASPARVVALVDIVRQHMIQTRALQLSNQERDRKTAELYKFILSERCAGLFARIDACSDDLLDLQVKERRAHEATWKKQGELVRSVQKVNADIKNEIDLIVGTAEESDGTVDA